MPKVTAAPAATVAHADFRPPPVELGQIVLWSYGDGDPPTPAVVLRVATRTLLLSVHVPGVKDHVNKTGVRHVSDPFLKTSPAHDMGVWDLTPRDRRIDALLESLGSQHGEE